MLQPARRSAALVASVALATLGIGSFVSAPSAGALTAIPFSYTGDTQTYDVPRDGSVCFVGIAAAGANGGDAALLDDTVIAPGGTGGTVFAAFAVTPGDTITVDVGGRGDDGGQTASGASGGFGGGGEGGSGTAGGGEFPLPAEGGGAGGGGATTVTNGNDVLLVAGGGGGAGTIVFPGGFGGSGGEAGGPGNGEAAGGGLGGAGGQGGTPSAGGGGGGAGGGDATAGTAGTSGQGGDGGDGGSTGINGGGGGGGGGFFGGGGGGGAINGGGGGGGGGGAGFASPEALVVLGNLEEAVAPEVGNGQVLIVTVGCAAVAVFKVVDSAPPSPTTFTVHVACTSGSTDLTYDESGVALDEEIFEAHLGDTCSINETVTGGAQTTTYACTDVFGAACRPGGQTIEFSSAVTPQIALVIVTNSFVLEVQPRLAG